MSDKSERTLPFGDLSKDRGRERLFTIGLCLGVILGMTVTTLAAKIVIGVIAVAVIAVRTTAQYRHPDRDVPTR